MTKLNHIRRLSSRRHPLARSFLCDRLRNARSYDRIAGYFCSSLLEVAGEQLDSVSGAVRMVCNSDRNPRDVETARAVQAAVRRSWCAFEQYRASVGWLAEQLTAELPEEPNAVYSRLSTSGIQPTSPLGRRT